jgi:hypothetical protein
VSWSLLGGMPMTITVLIVVTGFVIIMLAAALKVTNCCSSSQTQSTSLNITIRK